MNFRQKIVWTAISCTLILAVLFTVISIVNFNSQNASASPWASNNEVAIKTKINFYAAAALLTDPVTATDAIILKAIKDNTNLRVVKYGEEKPRSDWIIYYLINQEEPDICGMSITLTHHGTFVMNHIKTIRVDGPIVLQPFIDDMIEVVLNVIQQKMKNKDAPIIVTDKSTIAN